MSDYKNENIKRKGNIGIKCGNITYEKSISEDFLHVDSIKIISNTHKISFANVGKR